MKKLGSILQLKDLEVDRGFNYSQSCGANNCPKTILPIGASKPTVASIYALCGTLNGACLLSIFITLLFVDDLKYDEDLNPIKRGNITISSISKTKSFISLKIEMKTLF